MSNRLPIKSLIKQKTAREIWFKVDTIKLKKTFKLI